MKITELESNGYPCVNLNGTDRVTLTDERATVYEACTHLLAALSHQTIHGRDFDQVYGSTEARAKAIDRFQRHKKAITEIRDEILQEIQAIKAPVEG